MRECVCVWRNRERKGIVIGYNDLRVDNLVLFLYYCLSNNHCSSPQFYVFIYLSAISFVQMKKQKSNLNEFSYQDRYLKLKILLFNCSDKYDTNVLGRLWIIIFLGE